jgi:hypothetical protein
MDSTKDWGGLAALLLDAGGDRVAALGHPLWVQVLDAPDGEENRFALAFSDADDGLMGWAAGPDCQAVGMIGSGRLRPLPGADAVVAVDAVRMVCLVTRAGEVFWRMARADGSEPEPETETETGTATAMTDLPPSEGRLLDCLRRCFGLPTPPAPVSPARLQIIVWLVAALEQAEGARRPLSWSEVCRLHPLARLLAAELDRPASEVADITDAVTRIGGSAYSWEDIRLQASRRESFLDDIIHPDLAGWMDDGMFARWVLSDLPSADELFAVLRPRLTPSAARRMAHAVHAAGVIQRPAVI